MASVTVGNSIEHPGVITEITSDTIRVNIISESACSSCHAQSTCSVSDKEIKTIDVARYDRQFEVGDQVHVLFQKSLGPLAILLGYLLPLIILVIILSVSWSVTNSEVQSGLLSIGGVMAYYGVLALFRRKLKSTFTFTIQKG